MSLVLQKKKILLVGADQRWGSALKKNLDGQLDLSLGAGLDDRLGQTTDQLYDIILLSSDEGKKLDSDQLKWLKAHGERTRILLFDEAAATETDWTEYPLSVIDNIVAKPMNADDFMRIIGEQTQKPEVSLRYHLRLISSFTMATREILEFYTQQYPVIGEVRLTKDNHAHKEITGLISFIGQDAKGTLSIDFDEAFFQKVAQATLADESAASDPESLHDFAGEICNQVLGKVKVRLANEGVRLTASLPRVVKRLGKPVFDEMHHEIVQVQLQMHQSHCVLRFNML